MKLTNCLPEIESHVKSNTNWVYGVEKGKNFTSFVLYNSGGAAASLTECTSTGKCVTSAYNKHCLNAINSIAERFDIPINE